ncbi:MAG TPA: glycogen/starch/alpha-glucan phosphorylase [Thermodesulfobacteriota bacterium]|jgi:starch phosphorylase
MRDTKTKAIPLASTVSKELAKIVTQYGCGPKQLAGTDNAFYERHLVFDNVIDPTGASPRKAVVNVAGCGKFSRDRTIAEYAAGIWKVEPCPVP